jgi:hypothetical protein
MINKSLIVSNKLKSIDSIKEALIKACINSRPSYFKPFLSSDKVTTEWPDKETFYKFFKYMLSASRKISEGELYLKIKLPDKENKNVQHYEFYDSVHLHSRLTIIVVESNDSIHLDILPF